MNGADINTEPDSADLASDLNRVRDLYFDALVDAQTRASGPAHADSQRELAVAKQKYNEARRSLGLEQIK